MVRPVAGTRDVHRAALPDVPVVTPRARAATTRNARIALRARSLMASAPASGAPALNTSHHEPEKLVPYPSDSVQLVRNGSSSPSETLPPTFHSVPRSDTGADERDTFQASERGVPRTPPASARWWCTIDPHGRLTRSTHPQWTGLFTVRRARGAPKGRPGLSTRTREFEFQGSGSPSETHFETEKERRYVSEQALWRARTPSAGPSLYKEVGEDREPNGRWDWTTRTWTGRLCGSADDDRGSSRSPARAPRELSRRSKAPADRLAPARRPATSFHLPMMSRTRESVLPQARASAPRAASSAGAAPRVQAAVGTNPSDAGSVASGVSTASRCLRATST